ncbi:MAG TPA: argininosuccinate synthase [Polyangia bacterium]|jgi:argininosuccinate synthase|nr:argininosuccinate synthase [Polyangia bacterium]
MKIVLAYSGGLDTSVAIHWLRTTYQAEIIAYCADVGQGEDLEAVRRKALATGAARVHVVDLRETFVRDFVFPALRADAVYQGEYLMGTSLARPVIAQGQMAVVAEERAEAVSHGATGKGNDQVRFELGYYHFDPSIRIIAPWREWTLRSRSELIAYAREHQIPVEATLEKPYSIDRNLYHTSYEGGILEDPWREPDESLFERTRSVANAPEAPCTLDLDFEAGTPVAVNGERLSPAALLERLNALGGEHGVGRVDVVEDRYVGMKCRGIYETPGGTVLRKARRAVESITLDREVAGLRDTLMPRYAELVYRGFWFSPERRLLQQLIDEAAKPVTGTARVRLHRGNVSVVGRKAPASLYRPEFATFERETVYDQKDATGFIRLNALRLRIAALRERG